MSVECCKEAVSTWRSQHMDAKISLTRTSTTSRGSNHAQKGLYTTHMALTQTTAQPYKVSSSLQVLQC